jgi:hypothetical protein
MKHEFYRNGGSFWTQHFVFIQFLAPASWRAPMKPALLMNCAVLV